MAVVLDDIVMATLPIKEQVTKGHFAFTGDYTEAETRVLVMSLYKGPPRFPLQKIRDIEVPAP